MARLRTHNNRRKRMKWISRMDRIERRIIAYYSAGGKAYGKSRFMEMLAKAYEDAGHEVRRISVTGRFSSSQPEIQYLPPVRDLHSEAAREIFGADFTPEQRRRAKAMNYQSIYGMRPK